MSAISHHAALIYVMVLASAADTEMTDLELLRIGAIVENLPIFRDYPTEALGDTAAACAELLDSDDGLDRAFDLIADALPEKLCETAYALACDIVAADGTADQEELLYLEMVRHRLNVDRLTAAAIERGARARFATI